MIVEPSGDETSRGPDFIGVGPEKTGTTWIDAQLRYHPSVRLTRVKELRYFWEAARFPGESGWSRFLGRKSWHRRDYRAYAYRRLGRIIRNPRSSFFLKIRETLWDLKYVFGVHDDAWYLSCFKHSPDTICGEISPQYFFLQESQIENIARMLPSTRIIVSLRNPVDWVWSFTKMNIKNGWLDAKYGGDASAFIDTKIQSGSYSAALAKWYRHFGEDRVRVLFFDDLEKDSWAFYCGICDDLGIEPEPALRARIAERVNPGSKEPIPHKYAARAFEGWREDIGSLREMLLARLKVGEKTSAPYEKCFRRFRRPGSNRLPRHRKTDGLHA